MNEKVDTFAAEWVHNGGMINAERLLIERRRLGLTQAALAKEAGVSREYISQIENNRDVDIGVKTLYAIAEALGVSPLYLLGETEDPLHGIADSGDEPQANDEGGIWFYDGNGQAVMRLDAQTGELWLGGRGFRGQHLARKAGGAFELLGIVEGLSEHGRGLLVSIARSIREFERQWHDYQSGTNKLEAVEGAYKIEAVNRQLALRAVELGSMDAAIQELRASLAAEEAAEQKNQ